MKRKLRIAVCQFPVSSDIRKNAAWIMKQMAHANSATPSMRRRFHVGAYLTHEQALACERLALANPLWRAAETEREGLRWPNTDWESGWQGKVGISVVLFGDDTRHYLGHFFRSHFGLNDPAKGVEIVLPVWKFMRVCSGELRAWDLEQEPERGWEHHHDSV